MKLKTGSKVNIGLRVHSQRADGYHLISTVFQELDFGDSIEIIKIKSGCMFSSNVDWLENNNSNLCVSAWEKMKEYFSNIKGVKITLKKQIPSGSGLGGGSSNAAGIINGLDKLYNLKLNIKERESIAGQLGADIPFFINGGTQIGTDIGNKLTVLSESIGGVYLLIIPKIKINTSWAYGQIKKKLDFVQEPPNFASFLKEKYFPDEIFNNDFEKVIFPTYPEIGQIKTSLLELGARFASLSGSGSTVFGIFNNESAAKSAESFFKSSHHTVITNPKKR